MFGIGTIEELFPKELLATYRTSGAYSSRLVPVANNFSDWFSASGIPFFKFYTDHSENHCFDVFQTAIEFMSPDAYKFVSAQDLSLLFVACFCHDSGMHLTEPQFQNLVAPTNSAILCPFDQDSWFALWMTFLEEAKRFNQQILMAIFGDTEPIEPPPSDVQDFTDRHRQLIGEFLRRHHPRLAHDLCLGLDKVLSLPDLFYGLNETERDIIGLISRSHGLRLRELFNYIEATFHLRDFNCIHIVYIMILLRLADYAQIQPHRASLTKARIHKIKSPISAREWRVHNSIKNITRTHDDPESIFIDSVPNNVEDFLRAKDWLDDLQLELDKSWAILGEIYGRQQQTGLDKLTLSIRRVRSSILDGGKNFDFIAERVRFRVAESEMLLLLLAPLYGDHPGYGVRELLQNAHDAVQEAIYLNAEHLLREKPSVAVTINCSPSKSYFEIVDNGVGMTSDVIIHYFLNAGASFRASSERKKKFLDEMGKSEIVRSGRFGVGLLAAFLIGDKITVSTRHYLNDEDGGLSFDAKLDQPEIEIRRCSRAVGTNILIEMQKKNHDVLLKWANIMRELFSFDQNIIFKVKVVSETGAKDISLNAAGDSGRFKFATEQYAEIIVSTRGRYERGLNFVNGIAIGGYNIDHPDLVRGSDSSLYRRLAPTQRPKQIFRYVQNLFEDKNVRLRITDKNGVCPLNLSRTRFDRPDETITMQINNFVIESIIAIFNEIFNNSHDIKTISESVGKSIVVPNKTAFVYSYRWFCPCDADILNKTKLNRIIQASFDMEKLHDILQLVGSAGLVFDTEKAVSPSSFVYRVRELRQIYQSSTQDCFSMVIPRELSDATRKMANISKWLTTFLDGGENIELTTTKCLYLFFGRKSENDKEVLINFVKATGVTFAKLSSCCSWSNYSSGRNTPTPQERETFGTLWEKKIGGLWSWPKGYDIGTFGKFLG